MSNSRCRYEPSPRSERLGTLEYPAIRFTRGTYFEAYPVRLRYGLPGCSPSCTDQTGYFPAHEGFYSPAFHGLAAPSESPIAGARPSAGPLRSGSLPVRATSQPSSAAAPNPQSPAAHPLHCPCLKSYDMYLYYASVNIGLIIYADLVPSFSSVRRDGRLSSYPACL